MNMKYQQERSDTHNFSWWRRLYNSEKTHHEARDALT